MGDETNSTSNNRHPKISDGIFQCIQKVWDNNEFKDFEVSVNGEIFSCHTFMLASCSEFFSGLLRSNMREKKEMRVELNTISPSTFQLIIDSLYSGCDCLTKENVTGVWSAAHQLQIQFLIEHCEEFVLENLSLDTIEVYKDQAEYLQSEKVKPYIFDFMLNHFDEVRQKDLLLRLDFDYLMRLVESDELNVSSEDSVMFSIFKWANHGNVCRGKSSQIKASITNTDTLLNAEQGIESLKTPEEPNIENSHVNLNINSITEDQQGDTKSEAAESNDRKHLLIPLLKASRYYLASEACIVELYKDKLIHNDILVKEILFEAIDFKLCGYSHMYCPTPAINRDCSGLENVGVMCNTRTIEAISFRKNASCEVKELPKDLDATIAIFKSQIYICLFGIAPTKVYKLENNLWEKVTKIAHCVQLFLAHEKYIYAFDTVRKNITRFNPETTPIVLEAFKHEIDKLSYGLSFGKKFILFSSEFNNGVEEAAVHCWNTETNEWTKHHNLKLSAQNLQSFGDGINTYILDVYGNLCKLENPETIRFSFVDKLWTEKYNIKGAILFRGSLHVLEGSENEIDMKSECEGVYTSSFYWEVGDEASNVLHYTMPTLEINRSWCTIMQD